MFNDGGNIVVYSVGCVYSKLLEGKQLNSSLMSLIIRTCKEFNLEEARRREGEEGGKHKSRVLDTLTA